MASSSSSSSVVLQSEYDVFLSFRGEDTRDNFTSHLYAALCKKQIQTFIDDDRLQRGEEIAPALLKAIEESKISIIIFSKDYASSKWCLDELVKILECRKMNGQLVMPVFYHITPSDVRKQTGSFKDAFAKHAKDFKMIPEKVQRWRIALTEASNLSGWDSTVIRSESKLVGEIVREILKKLNGISSSSNCEGLVGLESRINDINSLLKIGLSNIRIVGIWGMGGIGKTTIAGVVFNQISSKFQGCCFIANVREESKRCGLVHVRNQVLSQILEENLAIGTPSIPQFIKKRLQCKKFLLVYDDVDDLRQLEFLVGGLPQFGLGSRIIITTRDKQVLCSYGVDHIYEVKRLEDDEALQLFCNYAFKNNPPGALEMFSRRITEHANGNPLALKVLGSSLYRKSKQEWESAICKLKKISDPKIHNVLIISYNGLDVEQKNIFLDIACFFRGWDIDYVTEILDSCYNSSYFGLSVLIDKSLIFTTQDNEIQMHDLLQEMGWEIVRQESLKVPGKRSRLWHYEDVFYVLKNNTGTEAVEGLFLDMSKITDLYLSSKAFENMPNLKFLKFYAPDWRSRDVVNINKVHLPQGLNYISDEMRYLYWHGYPLEALPSNFSPKNLIELNLPCSNVDEKLWLETKHGSKHSYHPQLEHCRSLLDVSLSIKYLTNLHILNLLGCKSIRSFPSNIHFISPIILGLADCVNLTNFPQISGNVKELYLGNTAIDEVPSSIGCLTELNRLNLWSCRRLKKISTSIYELTSLKNIALMGDVIGKCQFASSIAFCKEIRNLYLGYGNIKEIPEDLFGLSSLEILDLQGNKFKSLPTSIKQLTQLRELYLMNCKNLQSIPELPLTLMYLQAGGCSQLQSIPEPPSNLEELGESELKIATNLKNMEFIFTNCMKLNQNADSNILTNSQQRIQDMAALVLRLYYAKVFDKMLKFSLCLPGTEIPEWFSHQSSGSSIIIELPEHWCNRRFMGFALSAVLAFEENFRRHQTLSVSCSYHFQDNNTKSVTFYWDCRVATPSFPQASNDVIISNHIALGYSPYFMDVEGDHATASFTFGLLGNKERDSAKSVKIKCCGVHPVYAQSNVTSFQRFFTTSEDLVETTLADEEDSMEFYDANTSGSGSGDDLCNELKVEPDASTFCSLRACCLFLFLIVFFWLLAQLDGLDSEDSKLKGNS